MPSSNRKTRERQLAKLAARRAAERRRKARRRGLTIAVALLVAAAGLGTSGYLVFLRKPAKHAASPHASPTPQVACGAGVPSGAGQAKSHYSKPPPFTINKNKTYTAALETSCGDITMKLDPKASPNAVNSFVFLAQHRFFDGLIFHRIAKDFVIQGGDPTGTGSGGPGYTTRDVPAKGTKYALGTVAMAKSNSEPNGTAGSQFFIVTGSQASSLPADYAVIGMVTAGQGVADQINQLPIVGNATDGRPKQTVYIIRVTIKVS